jgi:hypothetical protein
VTATAAPTVASIRAEADRYAADYQFISVGHTDAAYAALRRHMAINRTLRAVRALGLSVEVRYGATPGCPLDESRTFTGKVLAESRVVSFGDDQASSNGPAFTIGADGPAFTIPARFILDVKEAR